MIAKTDIFCFNLEQLKCLWCYVHCHTFPPQIRPELELKLKQRFQVFDAILYRSQLVAGTNYAIKVQLQLVTYIILTDKLVSLLFLLDQIHVEYEKHGYMHVKVFKPLPYETEKTGVFVRVVEYEENKTLQDPIDV